MEENIGNFLNSSYNSIFAGAEKFRGGLMTSMATITISLPESLKTYIEERLAKSGYGTTSEYLRELIRNDQRKEAQLRLESLLLEGLASPEAEMTDQDWVDIRAELRRRQAAREKQTA